MGIWQNHEGVTTERVKWQTRENAELKNANAKILALENAARQTEQAHAQALNAIANDYQGEINHANAQYQADLFAVATGTLRLRDPGPTSLHTDPNPPAKIAVAPACNHAASGADISPEATRFLLAESARADDYAERLTACQQIILDDRAHQ